VNEFSVGEQDFLLDGRPVRVLSGALHYFRIHPGQWRDRVRKARLMGLNTIETYVPWNEHEPRQGSFEAAGRLDLVRFLRIVQEEGLHAIVRPGPYICAEFDGGGLPAWLFTDPGVGIRSTEPRYFAALTRYVRWVFERVVPLQIDHGGPVILMQVENEYGAYGADHGYLRALVDLFRAEGVTVPLTTVDQPTPEMLAAGNVPGLLATGSFGSRSAERLATLRAHQKSGPLMCSEFWCGWFDHWGAHHHTTDASEAAAELDVLLDAGASVNIYMFHGGTNFGLTNGANDKGVYQPIVTSYDYDAPLDEAGRPTEKFWRFREVISRHAPVPDLDPEEIAAPAFETPVIAPLVHVASLRDAIESTTWTHHDDVPTMDELGVYRGFVRYRTQLDRADAPVVVTVGEVRDRAWVSLDGEPVGVLARESHEGAITLPRGRGELTILVEDEGRVNYGHRLGEAKGLIGPVTVGGAPLRGWDASPVPIDAAAEAVARAESASATPVAGAALHRATFHLEAPTDLALDTHGLGKGVAWVNDSCLGRYWRKGPQRTLFVPGPVTTAGENVLVLLELETLATSTVAFVPDLLLGHTEE
jgi:beta-galactosidase